MTLGGKAGALSRRPLPLGPVQRAPGSRELASLRPEPHGSPRSQLRKDRLPRKSGQEAAFLCSVFCVTNRAAL